MTRLLVVLATLAIVGSFLTTSSGFVNGDPPGNTSVEEYVYEPPINQAVPLLVTTDKSTYLPGEPVNITATFQIAFRGVFNSSLVMYYVILDNEGNVLYDMSRHVYVLFVLTGFIAEPGYSRSFIWNQSDDNGELVGFPKWLRAMVIVPSMVAPLTGASDFEINPMPISCDIVLSPGWNLVSVPLLNDSLNAGDIGLAPGSVIVEWDGLAQKYGNEYIVGFSPESMNFRLLSGRSYFVGVQYAQTLTLFGCSPEIFDKYSVSIDVPTGGGWFNIGLNLPGAGLKASSMSSLVSGAEVELVCIWDSVSRGYVIYWPRLFPLENDFVIGPGTGFWLWVDGPSVLTYSS